MIFLSQDGLKAIDENIIQFFVIAPKADSGGTFKLLAKSPVDTGEFYEYLILFKHENIEVVKHVMRFLANGKFIIPDGTEEKNLLIVDLPSLYEYGMKKIAPELLNKTSVKIEDSEFSVDDNDAAFVSQMMTNYANTKDIYNLDTNLQKADKLKATLLATRSIIHEIDSFADDIITEIKGAVAMGIADELDETYENIKRKFFNDIYKEMKENSSTLSKLPPSSQG